MISYPATVRRASAHAFTIPGRRAGRVTQWTGHETGLGISGSDQDSMSWLRFPHRGIGHALQRLLAGGAAFHVPLELIALSVGKAIVQEQLELRRGPGSVS